MRDGQVSHHEEFEAIRLFLLPCATTELSLIAMWRLSGATSRGQPWTPAVTRPHGRDGLSARRMAVLWTFREPSLCRHVHRELLRKAALNLTLIIPATACHQRNYVERYSRYTDAAYLIADSILGELMFVRQALEAAGCERIYTSGDEARPWPSWSASGLTWCWSRGMRSTMAGAPARTASHA